VQPVDVRARGAARLLVCSGQGLRVCKLGQLQQSHGILAAHGARVQVHYAANHCVKGWEVGGARQIAARLVHQQPRGAPNHGAIAVGPSRLVDSRVALHDALLVGGLRGAARGHLARHFF
jgi:hypothetical protein